MIPLQAFLQPPGLDQGGWAQVRIVPYNTPVGSPRFALAQPLDIFTFYEKRYKLPGNVCTTQEVSHKPVNDHAIKDSIARTKPLAGLGHLLPAALGLLLTGVLAVDAANAQESAQEESPQSIAAPASADPPALPGTDDLVPPPETGDDPALSTKDDPVLLPESGDSPAAEDAPGYVPRRTLAQDYLDAIDRVEGEFGPYASELSDLYLGLGQTYLDNGEYEQARDAFHRGVMAVRVNSGPNSPEQTNHLYLIANIERVLGEQQVADQVLHNIYFINSEYYGEDSLEMLPVLERIYTWYQLTWPTGNEKPKYDHYARMRDLTERMVEINEANYGENNIETARAYRRLGDAEFQIVRHLTSRYWMVAFTSGTLEAWGGGDITVTEHYDKARKAYRKSINALKADPSVTPPELAEALANQADWYLIFGYTGKARNLYAEAWQVLATDMEYSQLAESFLGQPRPMHFVVPAPAFLGDFPPELGELSVNVSMTVTTFGEVRYVEVENPPEVLS
ncbi:MAG TPA: tetratricopeptide repeat protein, partial [Xanthomonadales bacterium]|nr:tetratricopeptide repeat protein [Xanthomonadales bacterium]